MQPAETISHLSGLKKLSGRLVSNNQHNAVLVERFKKATLHPHNVDNRRTVIMDLSFGFTIVAIP